MSPSSLAQATKFNTWGPTVLYMYIAEQTGVSGNGPRKVHTTVRQKIDCPHETYLLTQGPRSELLITWQPTNQDSISRLLENQLLCQLAIIWTLIKRVTQGQALLSPSAGVELSRLTTNRLVSTPLSELFGENCWVCWVVKHIWGKQLTRLSCLGFYLFIRIFLEPCEI